MAGDQHVRLMFDWETIDHSATYTTNQEFILLDKANEEWWSVRQCSNNTQLFLPANYLEEVQSPGHAPSNPSHSPSSTLANNRKSVKGPPPPPPKPKLTLNEDEQQALGALDDAIREEDEPLYINASDCGAGLGDGKRSGTPEPDYGSCESPNGSSPQSKRREGSVTSGYRSDSRESLDVDTAHLPPPPPPDEEAMPLYSNLEELRAAALAKRTSQPEEEVEYMNLERIQLAIHAAHDDRPPVPSADSLPPARSVLPAQQLKSVGAVNSFGNQVRLNPGRQDTSSPSDLPKGWTEETDAHGVIFYMNDITKEKWRSSVDHEGKQYFYKEGCAETQWSLPKVPLLRHNSLELGSATNPILRAITHQSSRASWAGGPIPAGSVSANWKRIQPPIAPDVLPKFGSHAEESSEAPVEVKEESDVRTRPLTTRPLDKTGVLNKTKIVENGKKVKKSWTSCYLVAHGNFLYMFKDSKSAQPQLKSGAGIWPSIERADTSIDLSAAKIEGVAQDTTSKKNCYRLDTEKGTGYLLQADKESYMKEWYNTIQHNIALFDQISLVAGPGLDYIPEETESGLQRTESQRVTQENAEKTRIKIRLLNWLLRRPTVDVLKEKGIFKNSVFGSHLATICEREKTSVPRFVTNCIEAIDKRGLTVDGIYRVNGNNAQIQQLRFRVDQNEPYDLLAPDEYDVHDITGALKLFFRELHEPLFPFNLFEKFMAGCKVGDPWSKSKMMKEVVKLMPRVNKDTLKSLLSHLRKVMMHHKENRMQIQNLAIVFGPSLMWPAQEKENIALTMVYQSQVLENLLYDFNKIFA